MAVSKSKRPIDLIGHLARFFTERGPLPGRLCVGLSGGRDSVVLLHAVSRLNLPGPLMALHVHHGLSPQADAWEAHCRRLCDELGVAFSVVRVAVERGTGLGLEGAARAARYRAFAECGAETLLLAHHQGDQAETLLFNLLRGCGVTGAAAMPIERSLGKIRLLRPLLGLAPRDLEAYASANGLVWVEDESNADTALSRNFLRHEILPQLAGRFPGTQQALSQAAGHFAEAERLLSELAALDWACCAEGGQLPVRRLRELSAPRLKNLLRWRLHHLGWSVPAASRLDEFVRQLRTAAPDRHPALALPEGELRVRARRVCWDEAGS